MARNPLLREAERARLIAHIKNKRLIWDRDDPEFKSTVKKKIFWHDMDRKFFPFGGSSRIFYKSNRTTLTKAIAEIDETNPYDAHLRLIPSFRRALKEWEFLIPIVLSSKK